MTLINHDRLLRVALFTHNFLEPTHHSIAQVIDNLPNCVFYIFSKRKMRIDGYQFANVVDYATPEMASGWRGPRFDVVQAIYDGKTALNAARAATNAGVPFILTFHGGFDTQAKIRDPRYTAWTRKVAMFASSVTVPSQLDVGRLNAIGVTRPITVIPVPVDFSRVPVPSPRIVGRLVLVARLIPKKGVETALHTLALLPARFTLRVVGDGPLRSELETAARLASLGPDRVTFLGELSLKATLEEMAGAELLLHPSCVAPDGNADGVPQAVLWAMAIRLPVVACATGSLSEIVVDGERGVLTPPNDPVALALAITRISDCAEFTRYITDRAYSHVCRTHDLNDIVRRWRDLYSECVLGAN